MTKDGNSQITRTITFLITIFSLSLPAYAKYSGGTGEPKDPFQIGTAADLIALGETPEDYDKHFILTADIDLDPNLPGSKVFDKAVIAAGSPTPFGGVSVPLVFSGVFDGNGHTVSRLAIQGEGFVGLFGQSAGEVRALSVVDVNITSSGDDVGGLVGSSSGSMTNCYTSGSVSGGDYVGGLVGFNKGELMFCYSTVCVTGESSIGGLVGANWSLSTSGVVTASFCTGTVTGSKRVGGLVGENWRNVSECYSTGLVIGRSGAGGLVGWNEAGRITNCYSTGVVTAALSAGGLLVIGAPAAVTASFWDTETSGQTWSNGGTGKTTAEMQTAQTFLEAGWDFVGETIHGPNDIWKIWDGYDYPRLAWEPGPNTPLVFVDINDPGFYGQMSKYEVTNAQYCDFLNEALASGDITIDGNDVYGASSSNSGEDYVGQRYYRCDGSGYTGYGATKGGASRIHYSEGAFSVDGGFDNHPVTYVSWYGAMAFCNYYGYYLPTEEQWQAVADYDGTFIYGCGQIIDPGIANYRISEHPDGTTPVGSFGIYGYGMSDMAGNVWEWTSSSLESNRIFRGGSMGSIDSDCDVSIRGDGIPYANYWDIGFRVCR